MIWQGKAFLTGYFLVAILLQAIWQARLFKANKPISHKLHAFYYILAMLPVMYMYMPVWWKVALIGALCRVAFFDPVLNLCRGKPLLYNGNGTTGSLQDRIENRFSVFWINVLKFFYVAVFIIVIIKIK
jgi:hypothetical protein